MSAIKVEEMRIVFIGIMCSLQEEEELELAEMFMASG